MKFSNGCWMNKEGVTLFSPAEVRELNTTPEKITVYAPFHPINHRGDTLTGPLFTIEITSPGPDMVKVNMVHFKRKAVGPSFDLYEKPSTFEYSETDDYLDATTGRLTVRIYKQKWLIEYLKEGELISSTGHRNLGYMKVEDDQNYMREQLSIGIGESIYGLGERFTPFIKNGQTVDIWNEDGGTSTEQSYKNIPFFLSSKGYGVLVNHSEKVSFEIGSEKVSKLQFSVPGESLEYILIAGDSIKNVLTNYTTLTGKPGLPPAWSFGLWLTTSFTTNYDEATVTSFINGMRERDIPLHTFHFDCFWMKEFEWCNFEWDKEVFPDPVGMLQRLKDLGLHICVWINPYIGQKSPLFDEGVANGYFIKDETGDTWQWDLWQPGMAIVDFTNPAACAWYESKLERLMDMGVDSFKTDFGERIPVNCSYYDGSSPEKMHNYYAYLYNKVVFNLLEKRRGKNEATLFARSASVGSQQFPVHWGGDCTSEFESMAESLRGGLSLCLSGFGFWSHDIGGFESTSTPDVYKRWAAFGLLSTHSRLHGSSSYRVPWAYDEESVDVVRFFTKLKCSLMPYLYGSAIETSKSGVPMMRAMVLNYEKDLICQTLDRQYCLGDSLLVAPILNPNGTVDYYLPEGTWTNYITNEVVEGGKYQHEEHGYLSLPLMVPSNTLLPVGAIDTVPDYDYAQDVTYHVFALDQDTSLTSNLYSIRQECVETLILTKNGNRITINRTGTKPFNLLFRNKSQVQCSQAVVTSTPLGVNVYVNAEQSNLEIILN